MCLYGKWKWEKLSRKASRETAQLKDRVKDLVNAIEGVFCDIFYCYKGAYWWPKLLLHIKKNTGLLNVERRAIRMVGDFSIRRVKRSCSLQLQKKKKKEWQGQNLTEPCEMLKVVENMKQWLLAMYLYKYQRLCQAVVTKAVVGDIRLLASGHWRGQKY